ncbi:MAG: hypothetical protein KJZ73_12140 [Pseudorhodoplanes sp.]|nr:hypothetical protein [Pseudorhodoplanes sp.]MBW7950484.1 hypothetical protein [Pseudorhodoplanes sp.]MCL4711984.1 hypothetical protein [Pseudorhodoplanes sp.]GIK79130.1 MAG: hypothetical protein BroJett024_02350 [Alphaproteobacteria bacterium]
MKFVTMALVVCLGIAFAPGAAFAQKKRPAAEGRACLTAGQTCSTECNKAGYCIRMVCSAGKWKKRAIGCVGTLCPPAC